MAGLPVLAGYPVLPWAGLMAVGFAAGGVFDLEPARRRRILARSGVALVAAFLVLRGFERLRRPEPVGAQASPVMTVLSFLRTTKYPPSLLFVLMTLGPVLLALAWFERRRPGRRHPLVDDRPRAAVLLRGALLPGARCGVAGSGGAVRRDARVPVGAVPVDGRIA